MQLQLLYIASQSETQIIVLGDTPEGPEHFMQGAPNVRLCHSKSLTWTLDMFFSINESRQTTPGEEARTPNKNKNMTVCVPIQLNSNEMRWNQLCTDTEPQTQCFGTSGDGKDYAGRSYTLAKPGVAS